MTINDIKAMLPEKELAKLPKFYSMVPIILENQENTEEIFKLFVEEGYTINSILDLRGFLLFADTLKKTRLEKYKATPYYSVIQNNTRILSYNNPDIIIDRLNKCALVGKRYLDENGLIYDFITDNELWKQVELGLNYEDSNDLQASNFEDIFSNEINAKVSAILNQDDAALNFDAPFVNVESGMRR